MIAAVGIAIADRDTPLQELAERYREPVDATAARLSNALRHAELDGSDVDWPRL